MQAVQSGKIGLSLATAVRDQTWFSHASHVPFNILLIASIRRHQGRSLDQSLPRLPSALMLLIDTKASSLVFVCLLPPGNLDTASIG